MAVEVSRGIYNLDADSLMRVFNISVFTTEDASTVCEFFNREGGLILGKGRRVPDSIRQIPIYVKKSVYEQYITIPSDRVVITGDYKNKRDAEDRAKESRVSKQIQDKEVIEKVEKTFGQKAMKLASQAVDGVEEIMSTEKMTRRTLNQAQDLVEETFKFDRTALAGCINALRTVDAYTYNHSFGVYLLFSQALEDFKGHMDKPVFYDVFKSLNNNVNFNSTSIKKYATAALLHDYGKRSIPHEILKKKSRLTDNEFDIVKYHPRIAVKELYDLGVQDVVFLEIIGNHHRDYLAFPKKGQSPLAQICNILDIYEACRSRRSYKNQQSYNETQGILLDEKQLQHQNSWDPFLFVTLMKETLPKFEQRRIY